jgi:hypothetical protein
MFLLKNQFGKIFVLFIPQRYAAKIEVSLYFGFFVEKI